jgi:hypothetical protein
MANWSAEPLVDGDAPMACLDRCWALTGRIHASASRRSWSIRERTDRGPSWSRRGVRRSRRAGAYTPGQPERARPSTRRARRDRRQCAAAPIRVSARALARAPSDNERRGRKRAPSSRSRRTSRVSPVEPARARVSWDVRCSSRFLGRSRGEIGVSGSRAPRERRPCSKCRPCDRVFPRSALREAGRRTCLL